MTLYIRLAVGFCLIWDVGVKREGILYSGRGK
jgi:hypothetical protein